MVTLGGPLIGSFSKFFSGIISDVTLLGLPRMWIVLLANILQCLVLAACIFAADNVVVTILLAVIHYLGLLPKSAHLARIIK